MILVVKTKFNLHKLMPAPQTDSLEQDIQDLQTEFESDRNDYLDTIRKQDQKIKWLQSVIDKIHPCLRRDSNYVNLDRIRAQSQWDEDNQTWTIPRLTIENAKLPSTTGTAVSVCYSCHSSGDHLKIVITVTCQQTMSLVCHGISVLGNIVMDICIKRKL